MCSPHADISCYQMAALLQNLPKQSYTTSDKDQIIVLVARFGPDLLSHVQCGSKRNKGCKVSSLPCCSVSVSPFFFSPSLRLPPGLLSLDLGAVWSFRVGLVSVASTCLRCCSFHLIFPLLDNLYMYFLY